jgi:hypothetical protein
VNQQTVRDQIGLDLDALGFPYVGLVLPERIDSPWSNNLAFCGGAMDSVCFLERPVDDRRIFFQSRSNALPLNASDIWESGKEILTAQMEVGKHRYRVGKKRRLALFGVEAAYDALDAPQA